MAASKINGQSRLRIRMQVSRPTRYVLADGEDSSISGLVVEYIVAINVTRVRFPADAPFCYHVQRGMLRTSFLDRRGYATPAANIYANKNDSEGIRTPAGRAQWISSPSP